MKHLGLVFVFAACAHNVPQDSATGKDGKLKGAIPIKLEEGEGIAHGIVTYPGGDRVDWRSIQLPEGKAGTLALDLTYQTPRPGLRVSFDVFDGYNQPIAVQRALHHSRSAKIDHAKGTYFVRIFAPRRGDAGTYKLKASFTPEETALPPVIVVSDPPKLPAIPAVVEECLTFDAKNTECKKACPDDAPQNWPGCNGQCRTPDVNNAACLKSMACTTPPDRRIAACMVPSQLTKIWKPCDQNAPDPGNPRCDVRDPVAARILTLVQSGDDVVITISAGSSQHIEKGWTVTLLSGNSATPVTGGTAVITHVDRTTATARIHLKREIIEANQNLRLDPPTTDSRRPL